jgi:hypothetical protein
MIRLQGTAIDLAVWSPPQRHTTDKHGQPATEKLPTQRSRCMLNPAGHRVWVALHSGSGNRSPNDPMALRIVAEKMRKGFLPVDRCPQTLEAEMKQHLPAAVRGRAACALGADDKGPISVANPCKCLRATEEARTAAAEKKNAENEARYRTREERDRDLRERQIASLEKQNDSLSTQDLQRQLADLQRQLAGLAGAAADGKKK